MTVEERISSYLGNGGLFNPEMMEHDKVRDLLIDCRAEIRRVNEESAQQLAACDCAARMDTAETHAQNKTLTRDNPFWSPAFESVMRRTAECIELRAWKESVLEVESRWDCQAVGKLLGLTLGSEIRPNIEPKIRELLAERNRLSAQVLAQ